MKIHYATNPRRLGTAVLLYAFLTAGAFLSLLSGAPDTVNGILWMFYVAGGIGLLRGKPWGRTVTIFATGGSVIAMLLLPIQMAFVATTWSLGGIPALVLLAWSWRLRFTKESPEKNPPATAEDRARTRQRWFHNVAYKCYIFLAAIAFWTSFWAYQDPDPGVIGFLVLVPFSIPILLALIAIAAAPLYVRWDPRLLALLGLTVGILAILANVKIEDWPKFLIPYGVGALLFCGLWFTKYSKASTLASSEGSPDPLHLS